MTERRWGPRQALQFETEHAINEANRIAAPTNSLTGRAIRANAPRLSEEIEEATGDAPDSDTNRPSFSSMENMGTPLEPSQSEASGEAPSTPNTGDIIENSLEAQANAKVGDIINGRALTQEDIDWAKNKIGSQVGDTPADAEPDKVEEEAAESEQSEGPPIMVDATKALNKIAKTPKEKNNMSAAANRVLGLTGDKKKDALKWLAVAISAATHGARGEPSPVVQMIMDDYKAKREQQFTTSEREATEIEAQKVREWEKRSDEERMALSQEYSKELAKVGLDIDLERMKGATAAEFDALKRMDEYVKNLGPDEYAKLVRAKGGTTGTQQTLQTIAQAVGIGSQAANTLGTLFLLGRR